MPAQSVPDEDSYCDEEHDLGYGNVINCTIIDNTWHVTQIDLSNNNIQADIPPALGNLSHLTYLALSSNKLTGSIPPSLGNLSHLTYLDLSSNKLTGSIPPSLGNLSHFTHLDLSSNKLTGSIPPSLGNLKNLIILYLSSNFLNDNIPPTLGDLSSLGQMVLSYNRLSGSIPGELGKLSKLEDLYEIFFRDLTENELNGSLPKELGKLSNLRFLYFSSNYFTGNLPDEYQNIAAMESFGVGGNSLTGPFPKFVTKWVNLSYLNLMGNNFEGKLPEEIFTMTNLRTLMVSDLKNNGSQLPTPINLRNMRTLVLRNCNIIGQIPSNIADQNKYWGRLDLSFNKFTGVIPDSLLNLNSSTSMFLSGNVINQKILHWINNTVTSKRESLRPIMENRCGRKKSKYNSLFINAGGERINSGKNVFVEDDSTLLTTLYENSKKPWAYSCLGEFESSTDSANYIQNVTCGASVPDNLYLKARLCPQSLTYYGFCLHNGHYNVKLYFAEIVFAKDEDYSSLGKRVFDIYIQGKPVRRDFNIKKMTGNTPNMEWIENFRDVNVDDNLLEIRLFWAGKGSIFYPLDLNGPLISAISVTRNIKPLPIARIVVASVLTALLLLVLVLAFMWRMGYLGDTCVVVLRGHSYTIKQVKDATGNFSPTNRIGNGRFGMIYKAQLPDQTVAVTKLSFESNKDQIGTEVYALKQLKHDNLVELLDVYSKKDLHLLIYEYMEKGSLKQVLFAQFSDSIVHLKAYTFALMQACVLHSEQMLLNLVDTNLCGDYDKKQALKILDLAIKCINLSPTLRPTMLEIVSELEQISNVNAPSPSA
ncbi:hypothetical protein Pint_09517 [Pistacia integerrima]|uniref:Uncharacterized protein n=1 Tax=Pistacia integerrima TaxID=434235 RepID=A0ACC0XKC7_9ROSI|nr:hypothetical protein Pint_09517 [Pistacia integerrima]